MRKVNFVGYFTISHQIWLWVLGAEIHLFFIGDCVSRRDRFPATTHPTVLNGRQTTRPMISVTSVNQLLTGSNGRGPSSTKRHTAKAITCQRAIKHGRKVLHYLELARLILEALQKEKSPAQIEGRATVVAGLFCISFLNYHHSPLKTANNNGYYKLDDGSTCVSDLMLEDDLVSAFPDISSFILSCLQFHLPRADRRSPSPARPPSKWEFEPDLVTRIQR